MRGTDRRASSSGATVLHVDFRAGAGARKPADRSSTVTGSAPCTCARLDYTSVDDRDYQRLERVLEEGVQRLIAFKQGVRTSGPALRTQPLKPTATVAAPITAINVVLERRPGLRRLLEHGGFQLFALYDGGAVALRYAGGLHWEPARVQDAACA